jgi:hypothetical protein
VVVAAVLQEFGRIVIGMSFGAEISEVWVGGIFGMTRGAGLSDVVISLIGPAFCIAGGLIFAHGESPGLGSFLNPAATLKKPFATVMLKLALASALAGLARTSLR